MATINHYPTDYHSTKSARNSNSNSNALILKTGNLSQNSENVQHSQQSLHQRAIKRSTSHVWIQPDPKIFEKAEQQNVNEKNHESNRVTAQIFMNSKFTTKYEEDPSQILQSAVYQTLQDLNISKIDLLLLKVDDYEQSCIYWEEMQRLADKDLISEIGLCGHSSPQQLEELKQKCNIEPKVIQIDVQKLMKQQQLEKSNILTEFLLYCKMHNIRVLGGSMGNLADYENSDTKQIAQQSLGTSNVELKWVVKYSSYSLGTTIVDNSGYIVKVQAVNEN